MQIQRTNIAQSTIQELLRGTGTLRHLLRVVERALLGEEHGTHHTCLKFEYKNAQGARVAGNRVMCNNTELFLRLSRLEPDDQADLYRIICQFAVDKDVNTIEILIEWSRRKHRVLLARYEQGGVLKLSLQ